MFCLELDLNQDLIEEPGLFINKTGKPESRNPKYDQQNYTKCLK